MKEKGEENLGNDGSDLAQPGANSSESRWEEGQEVIPTFFSTMNTRYSIFSKITGRWTPVSLLENQSWCSFQVMVYSNRIENMVHPSLCFPIYLVWSSRWDGIGLWEWTLWTNFSLLWKMIFGNDFIRMSCIRKIITGASLRSDQGICPVEGQLFPWPPLNCRER